MPDHESANVSRCCECGTERPDLVKHEGNLWCPGYGDCDLVHHYRQVGADLRESEAQRVRENAADERPIVIETINIMGALNVTRVVR